MYAEPGEPHHRPNFHAYYGDKVVVVSIDTVEIIAGTLPRRQSRFVEAWAELHQEELLDNWQKLQTGRLPSKIEPLR